LARQQQELEDAKVEAMKMIRDAEERLEYTQQVLAEKIANLQNWRARQMSNGVPRKVQGAMRELLQQHKGTGQRIELFTEKGAYAMQARKGINSFVIEIVDDTECIQVEGISSVEELKSAVQGAVRETIGSVTGRV
jgi:hypothetical protein